MNQIATSLAGLIARRADLHRQRDSALESVVSLVAQEEAARKAASDAHMAKTDTAAELSAATNAKKSATKAVEVVRKALEDALIAEQETEQALVEAKGAAAEAEMAVRSTSRELRDAKFAKAEADRNMGSIVAELDVVEFEITNLEERLREPQPGPDSVLDAPEPYVAADEPGDADPADDVDEPTFHVGPVVAQPETETFGETMKRFGRWLKGTFSRGN